MEQIAVHEKVNYAPPMNQSKQYVPMKQPFQPMTTTATEAKFTPDSKMILNEKVYNKVVHVPKRVIREEIIEDPILVKETVIEIANTVRQEKIVEVPEVEYHDKIKEVVQIVVEEKIVEVPKIEYCERVIEVPKYIAHEKYVNVPQVEYRDVITERTVEIPEIHQQVTTRQIEVPKYVNSNGEEILRPVTKIERKIPVPIEAVTTYEYRLAQFKPRVTKVRYPVYVPRFIPVPVLAETVDNEQLAEMQQLAQEVSKVVAPQALDLSEVDMLAKNVNALDYASKLPDEETSQRVIREKWLSGQLQVVTADQ